MTSDLPTETVKVTEREKSMVEIAIELPAELHDRFRKDALKHFGDHIELPGFRKGFVPEKKLIEHIGEGSILEEAASIAIRRTLPRIFKDYKIDAIGRPEVTVTKLAPGNPFCFNVNVAVVPMITLPDYHTIAKRVKSRQPVVSVTEVEVETAALQIRKALADREDGGLNGASKSEPPPLTLESVRSIGDFTSVEDFMTRLRAQVELEKERRAREKCRAEIADELVSATPVTVPEVLVEAELEKMMASLKSDLFRSGNSLEAYLAAAKKTEEEVRTSWRADAEKHATLQLICNKIAETERLTLDTSKVEEESRRLMTGAKGADPDAVRMYVATMLGNEAVFQFLEQL